MNYSIRQLAFQEEPPLRQQTLLMMFFSVCLLVSCATTTPEVAENDLANPAGQPVVFPAYTGPKTPLAVLPMGLSEAAAKRYPHLLEKSVGLGIHNVLSDTLYQSGRFRFVEDKESVIKDMLERQKLSMTGLVDKEYAINIGKMLGAKKVVYGEVFDYSEGKEESISGFSKSTTPRVRVGVQIRMVDLETLEYIPASAIKYGMDWGDASRAAIESAVLTMVQRLE
ncbi:MAG: CsgG/HfaB family protein [Thermodesulfobacteriota bacterium]